MAQGELACGLAALEARPRWHNPAWYTGEAAFGVIGLLLPQAAPFDAEALRARLRALPDFLSDAGRRLREAGAAPAGWVARARNEAEATAQFLSAGLPLHAAWQPDWLPDAAGASVALQAFAAGLGDLADRDAAAGHATLSRIMAAQHGLTEGPDALAQRAEAAFARLGEEMVEQAARIDPKRSWQQIIDGLAAIHPDAAGLLARYRDLNAAALHAARGLVTPASDYALDYRVLDTPFRQAAAALYFLFYRSPPPAAPGQGSVYWVSPPSEDAAFLRSQNDATIKLIHAVHHGSIGHHTHNARARVSPGVLGRIAGTDCATGIALLSGGMMVEGWACYAEDLLEEADGFYSPAECLLLKQYERRNAASVLVDVRIHTGEWSLQEAARFYREEAGFTPQRVEAEIVRNSMFPGSRLMYWAGVDAIRAMRRRWTGTTCDFHDALLSYGHVPADAIGDEMMRRGQLR